VIAHRGASGERPENSLAAFELAVEQRADMIETDLHLSRDGTIVIHHDASLARLGEEGEIGEHTASELVALDVTLGAANAEGMPTLVDVLDGFGARILLNLEIKAASAGPYPGLEEIALAAVEELGLVERALFSSFFDPVLERLRGLSRNARLGVLVSPRSPRRVLERARQVDAEAIHPHIVLVSADLIRRAHEAGLKVLPYTEDDPAGMERLLDLGVDGLFTNHPARLLRLLEGRENGAVEPAAAP
jgi:glycerophosphoryl diester phosphodiesterase